MQRKYIALCLLPLLFYVMACAVENPTPPTPPLFPNPVVDDSLPEALGDIFDSVAGQGGPCLQTPELGSLIPSNFAAPRVVLLPPAAHNIFAVEVQLAGQTLPYRFVTDHRDFQFRANDWETILSAAAGQEIVVRTLSAQVEFSSNTLLDGPLLGSEGTMKLSRSKAEGTILYWTVDGDLETGLTSFFGLQVGSSEATPLYDASKNGGRCIGCHTSSPDGKFVALTVGNPGPPDFSMDVVRVDDLSFGPFPGLASSARAALDHREATVPAMSPAHYNDGEKKIVYIKDRTLAVVDLLSGAGGTIATGDPRPQAMPTWSPSGEQIVYVSTDGELDGRTTAAPCDLFSVSYNNGQGGQAVPLSKASRADRQEFYPAFSPDGDLLAFNTAAGETFDTPDAELHLLDFTSDTDLRLRANDPPACAPLQSPGITNSWPKWAPFSVAEQEGQLYFLTFSSKRIDGQTSQIFIAPLLRLLNGSLVQFPALLLPGQDTNVGNHTPAWNPLPIE